MKTLKLTSDQKGRIHTLAKLLIGIPYKFGAEVQLNLSPPEIKSKGLAFDCSELVEYLMYHAGVQVPDGSVNQYMACDEVEHEPVEIGDLVFKIGTNAVVGHVGIICSEAPDIVLEAEGFYGKVIVRELYQFKAATKNNTYAGRRRFLLAKIKQI